MLSRLYNVHFQCNRIYIPKQSRTWVQIIKPLYDHIISPSVRLRRNVTKSIISDVMVIALLCWQMDLGMTIQTKFYRFLKKNFFPNNSIPEESRFNRVCNHDGIFLNIIRLYLVFHYVNPRYSIIDSFPMPFCKYIRDGRAKLFKHRVGFEYNSTKHVHYRGLKAHFEISDQGFVLAYVITNAHEKDVKVANNLLSRCSTRYVLADKGYISQKLHDHWAEYGTYIWTHKRKNMTPYPYNDLELRRLRRHIKAVFSEWNLNYNIEHNRGKCEIGFYTRLEQALTVDTVKRILIN